MRFRNSIPDEHRTFPFHFLWVCIFSFTLCVRRAVAPDNDCESRFPFSVHSPTITQISEIYKILSYTCSVWLILADTTLKAIPVCRRWRRTFTCSCCRFSISLSLSLTLSMRCLRYTKMVDGLFGTTRVRRDHAYCIVARWHVVRKHFHDVRNAYTIFFSSARFDTAIVMLTNAI